MAAGSLTLADALLPRRHYRLRTPLLAVSLPSDLLLVVGFALVTALCAQVRLYLPWTPVPVTGQTFAVLMAGAVLGSKRGALSQGLYLGMGAVGLPVFAGGTGGHVYLWGPAAYTAGYLYGFVAAAYVVGRLAERGWDRRHAAAAMLIGNAVIYVPGLVGLGILLQTSVGGTLTAGLYPFIPGDLAKLVLAAIVLPWAWALVGKGREGT